MFLTFISSGTSHAAQIHPPQPPALSRASKETHSLQAYRAQKISLKVVSHCQAAFPFPFSLKTKSQGSRPRLVECFATVSLTNIYNYLSSSIFRLSTVTWIWAIWDFSTKHDWLTYSVYSWLHSPFPKTDPVKLGREGWLPFQCVHSFLCQVLHSSDAENTSLKHFKYKTVLFAVFYCQPKSQSKPLNDRNTISACNNTTDLF